MGVKHSVLKVNVDKNPSNDIKSIMDSVFKRRDPAVTEKLQVMELLLENEYPFKSFAPDLFRELRENEGIDDDKYLVIIIIIIIIIC